LRGTAPATVGATVADLLRLWQEAKAFDWQPTTARDHRSRTGLINRDIGAVRLLDLDPFRAIDRCSGMRRSGSSSISGVIPALRASPDASSSRASNARSNVPVHAVSTVEGEALPPAVTP